MLLFSYIFFSVNLLLIQRWLMIQIVVIIAYLIYCMMVCLFPADRMNISKY